MAKDFFLVLVEPMTIFNIFYSFIYILAIIVKNQEKKPPKSVVLRARAPSSNIRDPE